MGALIRKDETDGEMEQWIAEGNARMEQWQKEALTDEELAKLDAETPFQLGEDTWELVLKSIRRF